VPTVTSSPTFPTVSPPPASAGTQPATGSSS
jgi:hypothetical protein